MLVERCRVLEESGCASVCINSCKVPTQVCAWVIFWAMYVRSMLHKEWPELSQTMILRDGGEGLRLVYKRL